MIKWTMEISFIGGRADDFVLLYFLTDQTKKE